MSSIELREITRETVRSVVELKVRDDQTQFVASNAASLSQAYVYEEAWPRAIYSGDVLVGFVMLSVVEAKAEYGLWRFMIGAEHQGQGHGRQALLQVIKHVRMLPGATELKLSYVPNPGNPRPFYAALGFEETGEVDEDEVIMRLLL